MVILHLFSAVITTTNLPNVPADANALNQILSLVFQITGSIALLMVVIGGFRYIVAHGDPSAVSQAKNTILYAIIGLIISISAYAIVNLVITKVT
jgi:hypothetical protein